MSKYIQFGDTILYPVRELIGDCSDDTLYPCVISIDHYFPKPQSDREKTLNTSLYKVTITEVGSNISRVRPYLSDVKSLIEKCNPGKFIQKWDWTKDCLID